MELKLLTNMGNRICSDTSSPGVHPIARSLLKDAIDDRKREVLHDRIEWANDPSKVINGVGENIKASWREFQDNLERQRRHMNSIIDVFVGQYAYLWGFTGLLYNADQTLRSWEQMILHFGPLAPLAITCNAEYLSCGAQAHTGVQITGLPLAFIPRQLRLDEVFSQLYQRCCAKADEEAHWCDWQRRFLLEKPAASHGIGSSDEPQQVENWIRSRVERHETSCPQDVGHNTWLLRDRTDWWTAVLSGDALKAAQHEAARVRKSPQHAMKTRRRERTDSPSHRVHSEQPSSSPRPRHRNARFAPYPQQAGRARRSPERIQEGDAQAPPVAPVQLALPRASPSYPQTNSAVARLSQYLQPQAGWSNGQRSQTTKVNAGTRDHSVHHPLSLSGWRTAQEIIDISDSPEPPLAPPRPAQHRKGPATVKISPLPQAGRNPIENNNYGHRTWNYLSTARGWRTLKQITDHVKNEKTGYKAAETTVLKWLKDPLLGTVVRCDRNGAEYYALQVYADAANLTASPPAASAEEGKAPAGASRDAREKTRTRNASAGYMTPD